MGDAWRLARDPEGTRQVQEALAKASSEVEREVLAQQLHGHVWQGIRDAHANHVFQMCISTMPASSLQFMIDELLARDGMVISAAKSRFACRIMQQLLKKCSSSQVGGLVEALLQDAVTLSCHTYGNYSIQQILERGTEEQRHRLAGVIASNVQTIGSSQVGGGVIGAALEHAAPEDQVMVARAVLKDSALLLGMAQVRHGHLAVLQMLRELEGLDLVQLRLSLTYGADALRATRFGRAVLRSLETQGGLVQ